MRKRTVFVVERPTMRALTEKSKLVILKN